jgi:hypothetical protein
MRRATREQSEFITARFIQEKKVKEGDGAATKQTIN